MCLKDFKKDPEKYSKIADEEVKKASQEKGKWWTYKTYPWAFASDGQPFSHRPFYNSIGIRLSKYFF